MIPKVSKKEAKKLHLVLLKSLQPKNTAIFYTDRSKADSYTSESNLSAVIRLKQNQMAIYGRAWNLEPKVEIADAEFFAILQALHISASVIQKEPNVHNIYIFVDSQASFHKLNGFLENTQRAKIICSTALRNTKFYFYWCPSHVQIAGNKAANRLAKKGWEQALCPEAFTSLSYLRRATRERAIIGWKNYWKHKRATNSNGISKHYCADTENGQRVTL